MRALRRSTSSVFADSNTGGGLKVQTSVCSIRIERIIQVALNFQTRRGTVSHSLSERAGARLPVGTAVQLRERPGAAHTVTTHESEDPQSNPPLGPRLSAIHCDPGLAMVTTK